MRNRGRHRTASASFAGNVYHEPRPRKFPQNYSNFFRGLFSHLRLDYVRDRTLYFRARSQHIEINELQWLWTILSSARMRGGCPLSSLEPVGLVGTGLFGTALVERLLEDRFPVFVYNRTRAKADPLLARGAIWSDNPLAKCQRVIFSLYTSDQVEGVFDQMNSRPLDGRIVIDTSTSDPQQTVALGQRLTLHGVKYLEAPFSGSSEQTRNREATALVAGDHAAFAACRDLWDCLAAKTYYVGDWGSAAKMKLVTNLVLGLNRAVLAEGLVFAEAAGLNKKDALQVLLNSPAYSRTMDAKGPKMVHNEFSPQARLSQHIKDVRLMLEAAARAGITLPISGVHLELLEQAEAAGLGDLDNSAIIRVIQDPKLRANLSQS
jgi:3-hydroxyisobutyrate dehydrogenase-like beta-hydroxyacid dehydrogenase